MQRQVREGSRPRVMVSACLLGHTVRFDGGHKQCHLVKDLLASVCELVPVCPEVGIGMSTPREPIRLVRQDNGNIRVVGSRSPELDVTEALQDFAESMTDRVAEASGYIFMQKSPSCGLFRVKLYNEAGESLYDKGVGAYAAALSERFPLLPMEESGRLCDAVLFENFITRVFTQHEWREMVGQGLTYQRLIDFHSRHKLLVMAHDPRAGITLGKLLAKAGAMDLQELARLYHQRLMQALSDRANRRKHGHVLTYMSRFFKHWLSPARKREWLQLVEHYRNGSVPLIVPMTLAKHYSDEYPDSFLARQVYLQPHPLHLGLRNSI